LKELNGFTQATYVSNGDGTGKLTVLGTVYRVKSLEQLPSLRTKVALPGIKEEREVKWMNFDGEEVQGTVRRDELRIWQDNWKLGTETDWRGVVFEIVSKQTQVKKNKGFRF
jgi:hypothetical protein